MIVAFWRFGGSHASLGLGRDVRVFSQIVIIVSIYVDIDGY